MKSKVLATFDEAVRDIPDGSRIMVAGFGPGTPHNLVRALYYQGAKDLTLIANSGNTNYPPGVVSTGMLIAERRVKKVIFSFTAATHASRRSPLEELDEEGFIDAELTPQGTLAERIRAGGAGIPAFFTPTGVGTLIAEGKEHREFNGRTYIMEEAITADYAFIRAYQADEFGNLVFRRAQRNFNPIMAAAARITIVEAEDIVPVGTFDPDQIHTASVFVDRIVKIPADGIFHLDRTDIARAPRA